MEIPKGLGSLNDLKERESNAFKVMGKWEDIRNDAYEFALPNRNLFNREDKGQKKLDRVFDSTAPNSIKQGASKLQENITPIWSEWATFEPSKEVLRLIEQSEGEVSERDIRANLEEQSEITFDYINRSNFSTQIYEFYLDLLIGTASISIDEDESDDMPIVFNALPQIGMAFEEGPQGTVENHWRRFKVKARNIERKWPGFEVSEKLAKIIKKEPDTDIDIVQGVLFEAKSGNYHAIVWVKDEKKVSWVQSYDDSSPMTTSRYAKTAGEILGRGPVIDILADIRSLNKAKEFSLTKAAIDLSGMWTSVDDGIMNPYSVEIAPGVVIPVGSNNSTNPSLARLDTGNNLDLALYSIEDLKAGIKHALFADMREPDDSVVSATQFAIETRELAKRVGSAFGRFQTEALIPILKRVHHILKRRGILQPLVIGGREVSIKFTSPLARAQDAEDMIGVQQAVQFTLETAGEDQAKIGFKLEDFGTWAAKKTGVPQELVRSQSEKEEVIKAGAEAAKAQMQQSEAQ